MKKLFLIGCLALAVMAASATTADQHDNETVNVDSITNVMNKDARPHRITPKYLNEYYTNDLGSNWFLGAQLSSSFFTGKPKGCGDMFDRSSFTYSAFVGKWHSPVVGTRIVYNGGKFKDMLMNDKSFNAYHADFLYNVTNHLLAENQMLRKWDVIPYLGIGLINGQKHFHENCLCDACNGSNNSLMITYGVQGRFRATDRLYVTAELGRISTSGDFDNHGSRHNLKDGMWSLSLGATFTIGKNGWKHPIDAKPYIIQNDCLLNDYDAYHSLNRSLLNLHMMDASTLERLRATLEAEGLWDRYKHLFSDTARNRRNYYKGLLSLRSRIKDANSPKTAITSSIKLEGKDSILNAPVYFFFKIGESKLTDESQLVNLDEIARIAKEHHLVLRIDGAADKATGSYEKNKELSRKRCQFIWKQLRKRGISADSMKPYWHGGVDEHNRNEEDRNGKVAIILKNKEAIR